MFKAATHATPVRDAVDIPPCFARLQVATGSAEGAS